MSAIVMATFLLLAQSSGGGAAADKPQRGSAPTPADRGTGAASQRGSLGARAGSSGRTSAQGAGIESGEADGMAGGRTDEGPLGGTGIRGTLGEAHERRRAKNEDQQRALPTAGRLPAPDFDPPAAATRPMGSGGGDVAGLPEQGARIPAAGSRREEQPGGAAAQGSAGHSSDPRHGGEGPTPTGR